VPTGVDT